MAGPQPVIGVEGRWNQAEGDIPSDADQRTVIAAEFATAVGPWASLAQLRLPVVARTNMAVAARYGLMQDSMPDSEQILSGLGAADQVLSDDYEIQPHFTRVRNSFFHYLGAAAVYRSLLIGQEGVDDEDDEDAFDEIGQRYFRLSQKNLVDARMAMRDEIDWLDTDRSLARVQPAEKFAWLRRASLLAANDLLYGQEGFSEVVVSGELSGLVAEHKVFDTVRMGGYPCRYATVEEEMAGIDIVVERRRKRLNLQVKGRKGAQKELRIKKPASHIPTVYVGTGEEFYPFSLAKPARTELLTLLKKKV